MILFFSLENPKVGYYERRFGSLTPIGFGHVQYPVVSPSDDSQYDSDATNFTDEDDNDNVYDDTDDEVRPNQQHEQQRQQQQQENHLFEFQNMSDE